MSLDTAISPLHGKAAQLAQESSALEALRDMLLPEPPVWAPPRSRAEGWLINLPITAWTAVVSGALCVLLVVVTVLAARSVQRPPSTSGATTTDDAWLLRAPLIPLVLAVVLGLVSTYALLLLFAFGAHDFRLTATDSRASPVVVAPTLIAGALTAAYAVLRLRAHLLGETRGKLDLHGDARADEKHRSEQEDALVERFSQSVALLAADHAISRIAGAHLILALGDEWPGGAQRCLDVLVSHLRGLRESNSVEDSAVPRGVREEVRLITRGLFFRLSKSEPRWDVRSGDFSGTGSRRRRTGRSASVLNA